MKPLWTILISVSMIGCASNADPPYDSNLDPNTTLASLSQAQRIELCEGWIRHTMELIGQENYDRFMAESQAVNSTSTAAECNAAVPAYLMLGHFSLFTASCEQFASRSTCTTETVDALEHASPAQAHYYRQYADYMSCDLAGIENPHAGFGMYWSEDMFPADARAAEGCFFAPER